MCKRNLGAEEIRGNNVGEVAQEYIKEHIWRNKSERNEEEEQSGKLKLSTRNQA